jgi:hypothetical protein
MPEDLRGQNRLLRYAVKQAAGKDATLLAAVLRIAVKQHADASLEEIQANLEARALEILRLRPDLEVWFRGLLPGL